MNSDNSRERIERLERQVRELSRALVRVMRGIPLAPDSDAARIAQLEVERDDTAARLQ